jgi:misacylated tRNA(Ala) deacylase
MEKNGLHRVSELLYQGDGYLRECTGRVIVADERGIQLDRTVFYAAGGGQPGDCGKLVLPDGSRIEIVDARKGDDIDSVVHVPASPVSTSIVGAEVTAVIDWERRHRLMRMHTCMHLLSVVIPAEVTGGSIRDGSGRLDFDLPEPLKDKEHLTRELNRLVEEDLPVKTIWVTDEELAARPDLVKTMSVKPPSGQGRVRLLAIGDVDLQACGGTHVARTGEIGRVVVTKTEKKGRHNRRVNVAFAPS